MLKMSTKQMVIILVLFVVFIGTLLSFPPSLPKAINLAEIGVLGGDLEKYTGPVCHIFFHSLIVYPTLAEADFPHAKLYANNMITVSQFKQILVQLYANNFILINPQLLYRLDSQGLVSKTDLYLPRGKKPLVLSLDDLNYYQSMQTGGQARKLILDQGIIKTVVRNPEGQELITTDGDIVPIVNQFIIDHPDFSYQGFKGVIGVTGFDGILGYRTQLDGVMGEQERALVLPVIDALKASGWIFASHSYSHEAGYFTGLISVGRVVKDLANWRNQIEPLVGPTDIFIGPFGQVFKPADPRRRLIRESGFHLLYGVGIDSYVEYTIDDLVIDRINLDGYRLKNNADILETQLGLKVTS